MEIAPNQRPKLERLCRYVSRPPVATERMALPASGQLRIVTVPDSRQISDPLICARGDRELCDERSVRWALTAAATDEVCPSCAPGFESRPCCVRRCYRSAGRFSWAGELGTRALITKTPAT